jgi:aminoglycoside phosphotransferase (APT) family kinase protein
MPKPIEPDDLVERRQDVAPGAREPLLVLEPLRAFLDDRGLGQGPISVEAIGDGHSFETFLLRRQGAEVVLRRPPRPPLTPGVHDVLREARVLGALGESSVRAPRLLAVCEDTSILGVPFTVMERVPGIVIARDEELPAALDAPEQCRRIGEELIDTLVELHACDFEACGLGGLGRADGFLERRLARNREAWERDAVREIPDIDRTAELLAATMPPPQAPGLVHGDFRLGNVMYAPTAPARLLAILDWETTTIGDPLADLGFTIATYPEPEDSDGVLLALGSVALRPSWWPVTRSAPGAPWSTSAGTWPSVCGASRSSSKACTGGWSGGSRRTRGTASSSMASRNSRGVRRGWRPAGSRSLDAQISDLDPECMGLVIVRRMRRGHSSTRQC